LLRAVGIAGIDRLIRGNVIAKSGKSVEAAGDIDVLLLDKTGTITLGNRMATSFVPASLFTAQHLAEAAQLASLADETPEGRSIVVLAKEHYGLRAQTLTPHQATFVPFTAQTRMSGVDILEASEPEPLSIRKGAVDAIRTHVSSRGGDFPEELLAVADEIGSTGGTPLAVSSGSQVLGLIHLKDVVKGGIRERFAELRRMGIRTVMITGDNSRTAAAIAAEAGVDDFIAQATPEMKLERIRTEQREGHLVAMTGDGTNDAPALAQADVGVAMNTGTQAAREAGNMVDLDSNPTKLIAVVEVGKQLLMTRGALTTFSIANDVAKYFAIIPAMFGGLYAIGGSAFGPLSALNVMGLHSPQSAILSAVVFNALIIIALIPLSLKGVKYRAEGASKVLRRNLLWYGVGGLAAPFIGIKLLDILLVATNLVK
jgi:potassium-transporting ATPase ATP-binding subunit